VGLGWGDRGLSDLVFLLLCAVGHCVVWKCVVFGGVGDFEECAGQRSREGLLRLEESGFRAAIE